MSQSIKPYEGPACAAGDTRVHSTGTNISGHDTIQPGTLSSAGWLDHCKPGQHYTRRHDNRPVSAAKLLQMIYAPIGRSTQATGCKSRDCSRKLRMQRRQNCLTHAAIPTLSTSICWQSEERNDWIRLHGEHSSYALTAKTLGLFTVTSSTMDTVTVDETGIHNTVSIDREMLDGYNTQEKGGTIETGRCRS